MKQPCKKCKVNVTMKQHVRNHGGVCKLLHSTCEQYTQCKWKDFQSWKKSCKRGV